MIGGDTDDLIQEGMIGLFKAVQSYRPDREASFQTFASLCIERQLYSAVKNSSRQKHIPLNSYISLSEEEETGALEGLWSENPEALIIDRENTGSLEKEFSRNLSRMEREVLEKYLQGYSYVQIADMMDRSPKSIDNALHRIRVKIRDFIKKMQK